MRNKLLIGFGLLTVTLLTYLFMFRRSDLQKDTLSELENSVKLKKYKVSFDKISNDFDSLMIIWPYANAELLKSETGVDVENSGIGKRGDINLIILLKSRKIIEIIPLKTHFYNSKVNAFKIFPKNHEFKLVPKGGQIMIFE